jgi:hypothetical protein
LVCGQAVASIEPLCPACGSDNIQRNDDSKWLIKVSTDEELAHLFDPESYYLVLFDFADFGNPTEINARIYEVHPRSKGFAYCMVDYYFNIRTKSTSQAPFNLWPFSLKFDIMQAELIYFSVIGADNSISTTIFPDRRGQPHVVVPAALPLYARSTGLGREVIQSLASVYGVEIPSKGTKGAALEALEDARQDRGWNDKELAENIAECMLGERINQHRSWLPASFQ